MAVTLQDLNVKLFTDGADKAQILEMAKQSWIRGFTTNPSLMKAAKVSDYRVLRAGTGRRRAGPSHFLRGTFPMTSRK